MTVKTKNCYNESKMQYFPAFAYNWLSPYDVYPRIEAHGFGCGGVPSTQPGKQGTGTCPGVNIHDGDIITPVVSGTKLCSLCVTNENREHVRAQGWYSCQCRTPLPPVVHRPPKKDRRKKRDDRCARSAILRRKARKIVKLLRVDQSLKAIKKLPSDFVCGSLRAKVRSIYSEDITLVQELSIKTAAKAEPQPCSFCEGLQNNKIDEYKKARLQPVEVNNEHLRKFARAFSANVADGWNEWKTPYIPNGNATMNSSRGKGGNWVDEAFSDECKVSVVHSSGKPRVITLYSSYNVAVLTPLHHSLFATIKRKGWLLVGSPTGERLAHLKEGTQGDRWLSFDYESATDNIKTAYVRAAVEILINKGEGLTDEEVRCLRVVSNLSFDSVGADSGQPMGSPMSFPLLCLINKTVVDMALTDLLIEGEIRFKEWSGHRCLINGDDLLTRDTSSGDVVGAIARNGAQVGLKTNKEKTMTSPEYAEINSSVFKNCVLQKKTNVSALWMAAEVPDVLDFARQSCVGGRGFRMVAVNNVSRLARQKTITCQLPYALKAIVISNSRLKAALTSRPSSDVPKGTNLFPVVAMPDSYDLSREEQAEALTSRVRRIKDWRLYEPLPAEARKLRDARKRITAVPCEKRTRKGLFALLKPKPTNTGTTILSILARTWENKIKKEMTDRDQDVARFTFTSHCHLNPFTVDLAPLYGLSSISALQQIIKQFNDKRKGDRPIITRPSGCPLTKGDGYVSLSDA